MLGKCGHSPISASAKKVCSPERAQHVTNVLKLQIDQSFLIESFDHQVLEVNSAAWIMSLQSKGSFIKNAGKVITCLLTFWFSVIYQGFSVDLQSDLLSLNDNFLGVPFVILGSGFSHVLDLVDAAGLDRVGSGQVDLAFKAVLGPTRLLKLGVEIDACVAVGHCLHVSLEVKVLEGLAVADIKNVASFALANQAAIFYFPASCVFIYFPTGHAFAVE